MTVLRALPDSVSTYSYRGGRVSYWRRSNTPAASRLRSLVVRMSLLAPVLRAIWSNRRSPNMTSRNASRLHRSPITARAFAIEQSRPCVGIAHLLSLDFQLYQRGNLLQNLDEYRWTSRRLTGDSSSDGR